jgi:hypothetical protein
MSTSPPPEQAAHPVPRGLLNPPGFACRFPDPANFA